ncbi:thiol:disulfide interchange protein DsbC [Candidatus Phycosocius bacilliformis]|uniref:Thiol:disulfide interchange protein n=1 Tax=Candidatus Phycosocius bacilliformis TaxID=1445552 RepID=A0A2P2EDG3_9PROT|nr:DsbC family protein [Candidatus Phycosocius bacilliformis]GBF59084.1 thiol:disulfide interchange protein DsbC [Candidatus Phycosocius bacilliformis]
MENQENENTDRANVGVAESQKSKRSASHGMGMFPFTIHQFIYYGSLTVIGFASLAVGFSVAVAGGSEAKVRSALQEAFPAASVKSVQCRKSHKGLCEVVTDTNRVFFVDTKAHYAFLGAAVELTSGRELVNERVQALAALDGGLPRSGGLPPETAPAPAPAPAQGAPAAPPQGPTNVRVDLPKSNAIVINPGGRLKLTAFTDLNCSYCARLHEEILKDPNIELTEYPIQLLDPSSAEKAKLVLCAEDRPAAARSIMSGGEVSVSKDCAPFARMVAENTAFAHRVGIQGTPMIMRADGTVLSGFRPVDQLRAFASGEPQKAQRVAGPPANPTSATN